MRILLILAVLVVAVVAAATSYFTVDRTEFVYLTQFGQPVETFDGETDAGFHWKLPWPVQSVQRLDHRLQVFDLPETELLTHDPRGKTIDKTLTIGAYVAWRIPDKQGVDQFIRTVGRPERAQDILAQRISSRLGAEMGKMPVDDLISVAPAEQVEQRMDLLRNRLLGEQPGEESLRVLARKAYGIDIVDIRLRRFNHPASVRGEIFNRIIAERKKKATEYQSEGERLSRDIKSLATREAQDIDTDAKAQAERLRKEADIKADQIRNEAHSKDRDFYTFLQKLQTYKSILGETRDMLLLSSKNELFDMLLKPPKPTPERREPPEVAPGPMTKQDGAR
jgi:membrane protease subunit HflC